jgi:hypothetical protein
LAATFSSVKRAGSVTCITVAVAVTAPLEASALKPGEVAIPSASVSSVAWVVPSSKLALGAAAEPAPAPAPAAGPRPNVTLTPTRGFPLASSTRTASGCA